MLNFLQLLYCHQTDSHSCTTCPQVVCLKCSNGLQHSIFNKGVSHILLAPAVHKPEIQMWTTEQHIWQTCCIRNAEAGLTKHWLHFKACNTPSHCHRINLDLFYRWTVLRYGRSVCRRTDWPSPCWTRRRSVVPEGFSSELLPAGRSVTPSVTSHRSCLSTKNWGCRTHILK